MSFSQKEYIFSHTMTRVTRAHQPVTFKIDLSGLIPFGGSSSLFFIDSMSVTAYKAGTLERIPVKFTVVTDNKKRVLTNDPCKMSSKWQVDNDSCMKIAGTDTIPFDHTLSVYDEENRQALINVLTFMMSNSLWASDRARGALDILVDSPREEYEFKCDLCSEIGLACITRGASGLASFSFPQCTDSYVCIPSQQPCADNDYEALRHILALLRSVSLDDLDILNRITQEMATSRSFQDLTYDSFPPRHIYSGKIVISYPLMKYITSLYQTMTEYADNFAIVDDNTPHIKVLIQSPFENIGEITGCMSLTIIYGSTLWGMYNNLVPGSQDAEGCEDHQAKSIANITQLSTDVVLRRTQLRFMCINHMTLKDWYNFYYG